MLTLPHFMAEQSPPCWSSANTSIGGSHHTPMKNKNQQQLGDIRAKDLERLQWIAKGGTWICWSGAMAVGR
uniref:Uncharacterized protein n=1 Tax=Triticum urartu TaxID=4572 RepID=A0A8R7TQN6_TRIUA